LAGAGVLLAPGGRVACHAEGQPGRAHVHPHGRPPALPTDQSPFARRLCSGVPQDDRRGGRGVREHGAFRLSRSQRHACYKACRLTPLSAGLGARVRVRIRARVRVRAPNPNPRPALILTLTQAVCRGASMRTCSATLTMPGRRSRTLLATSTTRLSTRGRARRAPSFAKACTLMGMRNSSRTRPRGTSTRRNRDFGAAC
jgi:hypothetical protein